MKRLAISRLLRGAIVAALVLLLSVGGPSAMACECRRVDFARDAQQSDIVAKVRIDRIETAESQGLLYYTATPLHVWKGEFDSSFLLRTSSNDAGCGMPSFPLKTELLLFADRDEDGIPVLTQCSGSGTYSEESANEVRAALGPGAQASLDPDFPEGEVKMPGIEPDAQNVVVVGGILLVMLGVVIGMLFAQYRRGRK